MRLIICLVVSFAASCALEQQACPSTIEGTDISVFGPITPSEFCESLDLQTEGTYEPGSIDTLCDGCLDTLYYESGDWIAWGRGRTVGEPPIEVCHVYNLGCLEDDIAVGGLDVYPNPDGADCELFTTTDVEPACAYSIVVYPPR